MKRAIALVWILSCAACGPKSDDGPSQEQVTEVQKADAAADSANEVTAASSDAVVDSGSGGATQNAAPTTGFTYANTVNVTVNFDALNIGGQDRYPNATGQIAVASSGSVVGTSGAGSVDYAVTATALTPCVFTDPGTGTKATIAAGSSLSYTLNLVWSWSDSQNWTVTSSSNGSITAFSATVLYQGVTYGATINGSRQTGGTFQKSAGVYSASITWSGNKTIALSNGHTVVFDVQSPNSIYVTIDSFTFGPYTVTELILIFQAYVG